MQPRKLQAHNFITAIDQDLAYYANLAQDTIKFARGHGADAIEVGVSAQQGLHAAVRMQEIDTLEFNQDRSFAITVYFGKRKGSVATGDTSWLAVQDAVRRACDIAKYTAEDEFSGLPELAMLAMQYPQLELYYPWLITANEAIALAKECEAIALKQDKRLTNSDGVSVDVQHSLGVLANSLGFVGAYPSSSHSISCSLVAKDKNSMQRDYWYSVHCDHTKLESLSQIAKTAAARTVQRLHPRTIATQQLPVIFAPQMARGLLGNFVGAISGGNLYREQSFLLNKIDQPVWAPNIHINEQPLLPATLGSAPFDADGVRTCEKSIVQNGILQTYLLSTYSARRLGLTATGNAGGVYNLGIQPTVTGGLSQILKTVDRGVLVTELMGNGVHLLTGDYSRGAFGYYIEGGVVQYPVEEFTIAGNLKDMLLGISAVGDDIDERGSIRSGSIAIDTMMVASGSGEPT